MLTTIAKLSYRRRRWVLLSWFALLVILLVGGNLIGSGFRNVFESPPGSDSAAAVDILRENGFNDRTGEQGMIVFRADAGVDAPHVQRAMSEFFDAVDATLTDARVVSPYSEEGARQVSSDRTIAYAEVNLAFRVWQEYVEAADTIRELAGDLRVEGVEMEFGGDMFFVESEPSSEIFGIIGAILILLIAFGSVIAMFLPIVAALFGIGSAVGLIQGGTSLITMPDFTIAAAAMIAIGVGIDYALLIVTRFRAALREGREPEAAVVFAINTAGRAVLFAGITFVISILGLLFMGIDMIRGMAIACAFAVLMTMFASVTLVPALLGFAGRRIDSIGLPWRNSGAEAPPGSLWHRWSRVIQRYPWPAASLGLVVIVVLTAPVFAMRLGFADAGSRPESDTTRRAYDMLAEAFGPGFNGPLILAAELPAGASAVTALAPLVEALNATEGVAFASPPIPNDSGTAAIIQVIPTTGPQAEQTSELVGRLRDTVVPAATEESGANVKIGGVTAAAEDFAAYTSSRLPIFMAAVLLLSFVLLMAVFRSVVVAIKAVIMNLFSIGAAYGIVVAIFQWGIGGSIFGVHETGPVEAWAPVMMFAILFGLSMDYEVFLLSRIREEYDKTGDTALAVADGLAATGRVITAAAAIMVVVFGSFALGDERALTLLGVGLASAILVDATLVRMVMVPATMEILDSRNWWMPRWLDRVLPRVHVEGRDTEAVDRTAVPETV